MKEYTVSHGSHPVDVSPSGRVLGPGESTGKIDPEDPHNKALIDEGVLIEVPAPKKGKE